MKQSAAFVLAAGLGTRLAPLTDLLPKPLVPVFHRPLVTYALESLLRAGVGSLALNTHHLPGAFSSVFGAEPSYRGQALQVFHEPLLLDTGGGIRNARAALGEGTFFLYNGDILADLPLAELLAVHRSSGSLATLLLREEGGVANVRFDSTTNRLLDLRGVLGAEGGVPTVYSGIAVFETAILNWIPEGRSSIIDALLRAMKEGERVGGFLVPASEKDLWIDIGTPTAYLDAHRRLANPARRPEGLSGEWPEAIHPEAEISPSAVLEGVVVAGPGVCVGDGAVLRDCVLWPGSRIEKGAVLQECIVHGTVPVLGSHQGKVL